MSTLNDTSAVEDSLGMDEMRYKEVAENVLTNDESDEGPLTEFASELFLLADQLSALEAAVSAHELGTYGLRMNGLRTLEKRAQQLANEITTVHHVLSNPSNHLKRFTDSSTEVSEDDAIRLRTAHHSHGDFDRVLDRIRESQNRIERQLAAKRQRRNTMLSLVVSLTAATAAALSLFLRAPAIPDITV